MILVLESVDAGFEGRPVLHGVSLSLSAGEILALIGPNGAGKSTILKTVFGLLPVSKGQILFGETSLINSRPAQNLRRGIVLAPQGEKVFRGLSVIENLRLGTLVLNRSTRDARLSAALSMFPVLRERLRDDAGKLSGGQQQMLVLARSLLAEPKLLLLDEPSAGLAPGAAEEVFFNVAEICRQQRIAAVIVEHRIPAVMRVATRMCGLKLGHVAFLEPTELVMANPGMLSYLFL